MTHAYSTFDTKFTLRLGACPATAPGDEDFDFTIEHCCRCWFSSDQKPFSPDLKCPACGHGIKSCSACKYNGGEEYMRYLRCWACSKVKRYGYDDVVCRGCKYPINGTSEVIWRMERHNMGMAYTNSDDSDWGSEVDVDEEWTGWKRENRLTIGKKRRGVKTFVELALGSADVLYGVGVEDPLDDSEEYDSDSDDEDSEDEDSDNEDSGEEESDQGGDSDEEEDDINHSGDEGSHDTNV